ncbi:DUF1549 domain-containing protein [Thalassoglobus sp. JC818]|uniref:DUF1549 domain-containing protein n=1 Tax=Thalassoglobus sp. JC818 TaxID=3232136 RepID=UPI003459AF47
MIYRISKTNLMIIAAMMILFASKNLSAEENLAILPSQVSLDGPESSAQLLVQEKNGETLGRQISEEIEWSVADESVVTVSRRGKLTPHADGKTTVTVKSGGHSASIPVEVSGMMSDFRWSFRNDVLPILTKSGCNMGSCHGALAGKGGFRLSLHGYDAETDHFNITKQDRGRRVEFQDPGRSLLLAKPTGAMPHKGGLRIDTDSRDYRILSEWIASGATAPSQDDPMIETIEVIPSRVQLRPGEQQQLLGEAHYHNGTERDVTQWVKWTSTNEAVCTVDQTGRVEIVGPGEGAIVGWFSSKISVARITVPYDNKLPADTFANLSARNFIDKHVNEQLARLNLPPSPQCDDMTFIRRVYLDTIGLPPTTEEVQKFLANTGETKRDDVIEHLLERPEFVDYWSYKWSDVLMLNGTLLRPQAVKTYYEWIHAHVANNTPWDQLVTEILTATGSTFQNGATNFYSLYQTPEDMTENACQAFMGLSIGCAKCHNHPLEKWTNDQYYGMANLFSRVKAKGWGGDSRNGDGLRTVFVSDRGELVQPRTGQPQPPTPLDGEPIPFEKTEDRRVPLAEWMTSPENPYFAKSITNRVWANYFGVGLVESVDDMRSSNPASNEELLAAAAQYLVDEQFNLKSLMRQILQSNTYQRSSLPVEGNEADTRFYSRYFPRRLIAEVIHDSIVQAVDVPTKFDFIGFPGADRQATDFYPLGTRAIQLYDSAVESYFLKTFGRNTRNIVCECERSNEPSMVQVLHMSNGSTINEKLQMTESRVQSLYAQLQNGMSVDTLIDNVYLCCLSRYPQPKERSAFVVIFQDAPAEEQRAIIEDLFWALLTSREFVFNH